MHGPFHVVPSCLVPTSCLPSTTTGERFVDAETGMPRSTLPLGVSGGCCGREGSSPSELADGPVLQTLADVLAQSVLSSGPLSSVLRQTLRANGQTVATT